MWFNVLEILVKVVFEYNIFFVLSMVIILSIEWIVEIMEGKGWF